MFLFKDYFSVPIGGIVLVIEKHDDYDSAQLQLREVIQNC